MPNAASPEAGEFRAVGRDQQRDVFEVGLLVVDLPRQRGAVGVVAAAEQRVGRRGMILLMIGLKSVVAGA